MKSCNKTAAVSQRKGEVYIRGEQGPLSLPAPFPNATWPKGCLSAQPILMTRTAANTCVPLPEVFTFLSYGVKPTSGTYSVMSKQEESSGWANIHFHSAVSSQDVGM